MGGCCSCCRSGKVCTSTSCKQPWQKRKVSPRYVAASDNVADVSKVVAVAEPRGNAADDTEDPLRLSYLGNNAQNHNGTDAAKKYVCTTQDAFPTPAKITSAELVCGSKKEKSSNFSGDRILHCLPDTLHQGRGTETELGQLSQNHRSVPDEVRFPPNTAMSPDPLQFRHVYRLFTTEPLNLHELALTMPSLKALLHDKALDTDESGFLVQCLRSIVNRIGSVLERPSTGATFSLTTEERIRLKEALHLAKLPNSMNSCREVPMPNQLYYPSNGIEWNSVPGSLDETTWLLETLEKVSSVEYLQSHQYQQLRRKLENILDTSVTFPIANDLIDFEAVLNNVRELLETMNTQSFPGSEVPIDKKVAQASRDLAKNLKKFRPTFDPVTMKDGLDALYSASLSSDWYNVPIIGLSNPQVNRVISAVNAAKLEYLCSPTLRSSMTEEQRRMWSVLAHIIKRLNLDHKSPSKEDTNTKSSVEPEEALVIQSVLTAMLTAQGYIRTPDDIERDERFRKICLSHSDIRETKRAADVLSPIMEHGTSESSTCDGETVQTGSNIFYSPTNNAIKFGPTSHLAFSNGNSFHDLETKTEHSNYTSMECDTVANDTPQPSRTALITISKTHLPATEEDASTVRINSGIIRSIVAYLRLKTLPGLTSLTSALSEKETLLSLENLVNDLDRRIKGSIQPEVLLSPKEVRMLRDVMSDGNPYSRMLSNCLIKGVPSDADITEHRENLSNGSHILIPTDKPRDSRSTRLYELSKGLQSHIGETLPFETAQELTSLVLSITPAYDRPEARSLYSMASEAQQKKSPIQITPNLIQQLNAFLHVCDENVCRSTPLDRLNSISDLGMSHRERVVGDVPAKQKSYMDENIEKYGAVSPLLAIHTLLSITACADRNSASVTNLTEEQMRILHSCLLSVAQTYPAVGLTQEAVLNSGQEIFSIAKNAIDKVISLPSYQWSMQSIIRNLNDSTYSTVPSVHLSKTICSGILVCCMYRHPVSGAKVDEMLRLVRRIAQNSDDRLHPEETNLLRWFANTVTKVLRTTGCNEDKSANTFDSRWLSEDTNSTSSAALMLACVTQSLSEKITTEQVFSEFQLLSILSEIPETDNAVTNLERLEQLSSGIQLVQENQDISMTVSSLPVSRVTETDYSDFDMQNIVAVNHEESIKAESDKELRNAPTTATELAVPHRENHRALSNIYESSMVMLRALDNLIVTYDESENVVRLTNSDAEVLSNCIHHITEVLPQARSIQLVRQPVLLEQFCIETASSLTGDQIVALRDYALQTMHTAQKHMDEELHRLIAENLESIHRESGGIQLQQAVPCLSSIQETVTSEESQPIRWSPPYLAQKETYLSIQPPINSGNKVVDNRSHDQLDKTKVLLKLVQIKRKISGSSQDSDSLTAADKCLCACILRYRLAKSHTESTPGQIVALQNMISDLLQSAETDCLLEDETAHQVSKQLDSYIQQLRTQLLDEVCAVVKAAPDSVTEEDMALRFGTVATLLWSQESDSSSLSVTKSPEQMELINLLSQTFKSSTQPLLDTSVTLSRPLALTEMLRTIVECTEISLTTKPIVEPERIAKLFHLCASIARFTRAYKIGACSVIEPLCDKLLEALLHSTPISGSLLENIRQEVESVEAVTKEETLRVLQDGLALVQTSTNVGGDGLHDITPILPMWEAKDGVKHNEINLQGPDCERLANALELVLYSDSPVITDNTKRLTEVLQQLRVDGALVKLDASTARMLAESVSSTVKSIEGKQLAKGVTEPEVLAKRPVITQLPNLMSTSSLTPSEAAELIESIAIANQRAVIKTYLSDKQSATLHKLKCALIQSTSKNQPILVSDLNNLVGTSVPQLVEEVKHVLNQNEFIQRNELVHRLELIQSIALEENFTSPDTLGVNSLSPMQHIDPSTTGLLHQCLLHSMQSNPPTLFTMLPLLSVNLELESSKDITESSPMSNEIFQAYVPADISLMELQTVTRFLQGNPVEIPSLTEQLAALVCIQRMMDGTPLWPSEAALLLASLQTLASAHDSARKQLLNELNGTKNRLIACAFSGDNEEDLYEGAGFELSVDECKYLRSLHRICEISVTRKTRQFIQTAVECWSSEGGRQSSEATRQQTLESLRIMLLYLSRRINLTLDEVVLLNRITALVSSATANAEVAQILLDLLNNAKLFALYEMGTTEEEIICSSVSSHQTPHFFTIFVPDMPEQLLGNSETEEPLPPGSLFLLFNLLHVTSVVTSQSDDDRLASKWAAHLRRLEWRVLNSAVLGYPIKLDIRSRTLILVACKRYRTVLVNEAKDNADELLSILDDEKSINDLCVADRWRFADILSIALAAPIRYGFSPVKVRFLAKVAQTLRSESPEINLSLSENLLVVDTLNQIISSQQTATEAPANTADLLIGIQTIEQYANDIASSASGSFLLDHSDSAALSAAVQCMLATTTRHASSDSWDIDEQSDRPNKHLAALGATGSFLSVLSASEINRSSTPPITKCFRLSNDEVSELQDTVSFWKTRILLDSQRQRTASIRKLSVSNECDITADMNNAELVNAVQLCILHGQPQQPQESLACVHTLAALCKSPATEYISISNSQRDALRLTMCSTRTSAVSGLFDPNLVASIYCLKWLLSLAESDASIGSTLGNCIEPMDIAPWTAGLRLLLGYFDKMTSDPEREIQILRLVESRMRFSEAKLESYWISSAETEAVQLVLDHLITEQGRRLVQRLRLHLSDLEISTHSPNVQLNATQQNELLQMLRILSLIGTPQSQKHYCSLIELLNYLTFNRPAFFTQQHRRELEEILCTFTPTQPRRMSLSYHMKMIRQQLRLLTTSNPSRPDNNGSVFQQLECNEAMLILGILQQLCTATGSCSAELVALQATLCYCVVAGEKFTLSNLLSSESEVRIIDHLRQSVYTLLDQLTEIYEQIDSDVCNLDLLNLFTERLFSTEAGRLGTSHVWKILEYISFVLPADSLNHGGRRLQRVAGVEEESLEETEQSSICKRLYDVAKKLENLCDTGNSQTDAEQVVGLLRQIHFLIHNAEQLRLGTHEQELLKAAELMILPNSSEHSQCPSSTDYHSNSFSFDTIKQTILGIIEPRLWEIHSTSYNDPMEPLPLEETLEPVEADSQETRRPALSEAVRYSPTSKFLLVDDVYGDCGRMLAICNSPILRPEEVVQLTTCVDALHHATYQMSPELRLAAQFSAMEKSLLQDLQEAADRNQSYELSVKELNVLQSLGQRLTDLAEKSNHDVLRDGLEIWLSASAEGKFIFDNNASQKLCSALRLARKIIQYDQSILVPEDALDVLDALLNQFSSTEDSGLGVAITGPHRMGPVVMQVLESVQRLHRMTCLSNSKFTDLQFSTTGLPANEKLVSQCQRGEIWSSNGATFSTTEDAASTRLDVEDAALTPTEAIRCRQFGHQTHVSLTGDPTTANAIDLKMENRNQSSNIGVSAYYSLEKDYPMQPLAKEPPESSIDDAIPNALRASIAEEQKRLKIWERLVENRLSNACNRVEGLLAQLPQAKSEEDISEEVADKTRTDELNKLRDEVLLLKTQLKQVLRQLQSAERINQRNTIFTSSMHRLMQQQQRQLSLLSMASRNHQHSTDHSQQDSCQTFPVETAKDRINRLYQSSDCIKNPSTSFPTRVHGSQLVLYKPIEISDVDSSYAVPKEHRISSLDRLHELIEIRRAVVAGSREELCRLGMYSSIPPRVPKSDIPSASSIPGACGNSRASSEQREIVGPRILRDLVERHRNYTKHLLGWSTYEHDQSIRVLDQLERRLTKLERQLATSERTSNAELASESG